MKIGVLSDTHIDSAAEKLPLKLLQAFKGVDMIIHAGDMVDLSVIDQLKSICPNVRAVSGNMDPGPVKKAFPDKDIIEVAGHRIGLIHGSGHQDNLINLVGAVFKKDKVDMIIFGHSHNGVNLLKDNVLYFNPGSPTDSVFAKENTCGIIEINGKISAKLVKL